MPQRTTMTTIPEPSMPRRDMVEGHAEGLLVTAGFHPLADFANFGPEEAIMLSDTGATSPCSPRRSPLRSAAT